MVAALAAGGAAINQLAKWPVRNSASPVPLDIERFDLADFTLAPAIDEQEFLAAIARGHEAVERQAPTCCVLANEQYWAGHDQPRRQSRPPSS